MSEGIRIRHRTLRSCVAIVKIPDYGPFRVTKPIWLRLDAQGEVLITKPVLDMLAQHCPGEWQVHNTVSQPPTQRARVDLGVAPGPLRVNAAEALRLQQLASLHDEWRRQQQSIRWAVTELLPLGAASGNVTTDGVDPNTGRQLATLMGMGKRRG